MKKCLSVDNFKFANFPFEKEVLKKAGKKDIITISIEEE